MSNRCTHCGTGDHCECAIEHGESEATILRLTGTEKVVVLWNRNVTMTPGKLAAQAVHAALYAYGIPHGSVVVLKASRNKVNAEPFTVHDAGRTELEPGTLTCGAHLETEETA